MPDLPEELESPENIFDAFCERIENTIAREALSETSPWVYWTMEMYSFDSKGFGGLGMLAADTREAAKQLGIPMTFVMPLYPVETHQNLEGFYPQSEFKQIDYAARGFVKNSQVSIKTLDPASNKTTLDVYIKEEGSVTVLGITEPNFGFVYQGGNSDWHRMYQDTAVGFGGHQALIARELTPVIHQLNEAPTVFGALADLDRLYLEHKHTIDEEEKVLSREQGLTEEEKSSLAFTEALDELRKRTIYTNHTLVQAVESEFTSEQFEHFVMPNLHGEYVKEWVREKVGKTGSLKLSVLALALAGNKNGVSRLHAQVASRTFRDEEGNPVKFTGITNGVFLKRWSPEIADLYQREGILDEFCLLTSDYSRKLRALDNTVLDEIREQKRGALRDVLAGRKDQYGNTIQIGSDILNGKKTKIFYWTRRFAGYKRPELMFTDLSRFTTILEDENIHMILAGRVHPADGGMKSIMKSLFEEIDSRDILKRRVHFVQDYDEPMAQALASGGDALVNTPVVSRGIDGKIIVSTEASGTSPMKARQVIMISREDGFFADPAIRAVREHVEYSPSFLRIEGNSMIEELDSLYGRMKQASSIIDGTYHIAYHDFIKRQEIDFLPISTISRMMARYLHFAFPTAEGYAEEETPF